MIVCTKCKIEKDPSCFYKETKKKNGRRSRCKECELLADTRYKDDPEGQRLRVQKWRERQGGNLRYCYRSWSLKRHYGLTLDDYDNMLQEQQGLCYLCGLPETALKATKDGVKNLAVDHCHKTGKVRKLLCTKCNTAIGLLNDDIGLVKRLAQYLEE
jgi:hypothetical protein